MKTIKVYFFLLLVLFQLSACTEDSDQSQPRTTCGIGFYQENPNAPIILTNLRVRVLGADSILYTDFSGSAISLPLRYVGDTSSFELKVGNLLADTLTIVHTNTPHFISMDAGYAMYYQMRQVSCSRNTIQKASVVTSTINANEQENIAIYYPEF